MSYSQRGVFIDLQKSGKTQSFSLQALFVSRKDRSDMNLSYEEAGRKKTSGVIPLAREPTPPTCIFHGLNLPDAGQERGDGEWKRRWKMAPCAWHLLPKVKAEDSRISTRGKCVNTTRWKVSLNVTASKLNHTLKQIEIVFFPPLQVICSRLLTLLSWWLPPSGKPTLH